MTAGRPSFLMEDETDRRVTSLESQLRSKNADSEPSDSARIYMFDGQEVFVRCQPTLMYQSLARSLVMVAAFLALTGTKSAISTFHTKDVSGSSPPSSSSSTSLNLFKNSSSSPKAY